MRPGAFAGGGGSVAVVIRGALAQLVLVSALIAGLLGMHALVVAQPDHATHSAPAAAMIAAAEHAGSRPGAAPVESAAALAPTPEASSQPHGMSFVAPGPPESQPAGGHGGHQVLHLCLAILTALLLLIAAVGCAVLLGSVRAAPWARVGCGRRRPPVRPPPTSVRLAQLCVLRT